MRRRLGRPLGQLRADVGLPPDLDAGMPYRYLHLCFTPPRFDGPAALFPPTARFLRHTNRSQPAEATLDWLKDLTPGPRVLVSMGTVFHRTPGLYGAIVNGLRDLPVHLLVALGYDQDPARLGPLPTNVRVEPWLPIRQLLPTVDLFVTHGGFKFQHEMAALPGIDHAVHLLETLVAGCRRTTGDEWAEQLPA